jgi:putative endonuclease
MRTAGTYFVYILASRRYGTLYIGVTSNVRTRLEQHRAGRGSNFVRKYEVFRLVHVEKVRVSARGDLARKANEELAARLEDSAD